MLGKIFNKKSKGQDCSRYTEDLVLDLSEPDKEEDGFLLVGKSLYERNVIHARRFQETHKGVDCPPSYNTLYHSYKMGNNNQTVKQSETVLQNGNGIADDGDCKMLDIGMHNTSQNTIEHTSVVTTPTIGTNQAPAEIVRHAYEDIPFQLSPVLNGVFKLSQMETSGPDLCIERTADLMKHEYEFTLEKSVLQECF